MLELDPNDMEGHWPDRLPADADPLAWVASQLRNCTDQMPRDSEDYLDGLRGTYKVGAQWVMRQLADAASPLARQRFVRYALCEQLRRDHAHDDALLSDEVKRELAALKAAHPGQ